MKSRGRIAAEAFGLGLGTNMALLLAFGWLPLYGLIGGAVTFLWIWMEEKRTA